MTTGSLLAADLVIAVLAAAGWLGGGAASAARRRPLALGLAAFALLATLARAITITALARAGWWFAGEKVLIAAPLALAAVVVAGPRLLRAPGDIRSVAVPLLFAGYAQSGALLVTLLHGYPASPGVGLLAVAGVVAATAVSWRALGAAPTRTVSRAAIAVAVTALVTGTGLTVAPDAAPGVPHDQRYRDARTADEPTRRFALTAGTATVSVSGRDVEAWAFNAQVPGPELTATVGDVLEVTLRNRDIERGVTLHWHGYDVPNSQDGVPGVTQAAVLPGQEFVYRFRADQVGTYWYHTHSVSDVGVRMGLYGVLVVHPAPVTGVDVTVPVHTLSGLPLPAPRTEPAEAGTPVRLRLVNTDSTTHRYALAGTPFRVAAIDGSDLRGPTPLVDTAVLIPAGGRYDLTFAAPPTPVALFVDGRQVYSTGPVSAATGAWPVLDPLTYGVSSPVPWSRVDKEFTLVLDRGLDLRGLLPRYAHTVNGAADPDIPSQVVRLGDIVTFTIVNRSQIVHPWHLHGHHVLVLSRNGRPATGSPLWLDSFDVRPGDVWKVAFRADNPGMWANHCHNLAHADAGMTLHLMYS
ncbi:Multicopper oxidase with three cupredoxin domains (includes cell division protein FtsP and spore coat protein CotA) [Micromonospora coriariae]|uniref:Multicopper oxidase with three cupredoxin domains (Includes cell division protein FtsP and spore coat protein CotA) n=1 Tax=Micromonospora coriariae TaxID=285665 RepID=A0A1C4XWM6_9ACTN|nr:multicopper oxidase family protein [Micromonospora coriariae]SCF12887.1 Multicopper oxidase with three cupredoxin domains (includes cell division protein FtsP and spore coat protein CotA) [Micromonospora coriariae]